jgi:MFS family permease
MSAAINNQFPVMLRERGFDASVLGLFVSCAALGGVSGSLLPLYSAHFLLAGAFVITGLVGARLRIRCRMYLARHFPSNVAGASATLQSGTMLAQFLAPLGGALLTTYLTASNVFLILGVTTAIGLGSVFVILHRKAPAQIPEMATTERFE